MADEKDKSIQRSTDAGGTWKQVAPLPLGIDGGFMCYFGWDPIHDIFYAGRMTQPTYKWHR